MCKVSITLSCFVLIFVTSVAMATPATTSQTWTFSDGNNPAAVDPGFINAYGIPTANMSTTGDPDWFGWMNVISNKQGVWIGEPLDIILTIPNQPTVNEENSYKEITLEMGYKETVNSIEVIPSPVTGNVFEICRDILVDPTNGWKTMTISWLVEPNPNAEQICIDVSGTGGFVDYITVGTVCVPEPATIALLGLGTMVLLKRKRK